MLRHASRPAIILCLAVAISFLLVHTASLDAQTLYGTILGQIQDQQGAAIGKAEISVRNIETGATRKVNANDTGAYQVSSIPPGSYEVSAAIAGFKTEVRSGITVTVGAEATVNFSLQVGAVTEKVEVTAEAAQVDTSSATMGGFVSSNTIRELPLNGRDWISLSLLQPGVAPNASQNQNDLSRAQRGNGTSLFISGGRHTDNLFRIDGISVNDYANGGPGSALRVNMGVDAIREFSVLTNGYSAEYGRGGGGVVNAITKSGTNELHGGAYFFHRNSEFDARNFFDQSPGPAPFRRHQYGGYAGGSIIKDKMFYFANAERLSEVKGLSSNDATISADARNGLFCQTSACTSKIQVPVSPLTKRFVDLFPLPNVPTIGDSGFFVFSPDRHGTETFVTGKLDHYFSDKTTAFLSYTWDNTYVASPDNYGLKDTFSLSTRQYAVLSVQHLFSPTLINNARTGVTRFLGGNAIDGNPHDPRITDPNYTFVPGSTIGTIQVAGLTVGTSGGVVNGLNSSGQNYFGYTTPQIYDDVSWTRGRHTIKFGANWEKVLYNINEPNRPNGQWIFGSLRDFVTGNTTGSGSLFSSDLPGTDTFRSERNSIFGAYIQDDFRILPNLTINLGLRYEMATSVGEKWGRIANLRTLANSLVTIGAPYYNSPKGSNFAPRIGFAWDPFKDGKTSIRGGFGMFDVLILPYMFTARYPRSAPFYAGGQVDQPPASSFPNNALPLLSATTLTGIQIQNNPNRSYRMQWNLNIQRQLTRTIALTVGYSGSQGVHLIHQNEDVNVVPGPYATFDATGCDCYKFPIPGAGQKPAIINPNYGNIRSSNWFSQSNYHGLQVNLVQRPVKGLSYQVAYTFSKSIDNNSGVFQGGNEAFNTISPSWPWSPRLNRGPSDFNIPHLLVANFQYEIPAPAFAKNNAIGNTILGGWQVGGIWTRQSGAPFSFKIVADRANLGYHQVTQSNGGLRPHLLGNLPGCSNPTTGNIDDYINKSCFAFPALGELGNAGRNYMRAPTFSNLDFTVFKNQNLWGERVKAQLRLEMFNILNNTNMTGQQQAIFDKNGIIPNSVGKPLAPTANAARTIQIGMRLVF